jgi:hypothetical protein
MIVYIVWKQILHDEPEIAVITLSKCNAESAYAKLIKIKIPNLIYNLEEFEAGSPDEINI